MYSTLFTPADLARDSWADINTIGANLRLLSAEELREAKRELVELATRAGVWGRIAAKEVTRA